jgi:hypothetical protein
MPGKAIEGMASSLEVQTIGILSIDFSSRYISAFEHQDFIALAISGATETVLTPLSRVSVARIASTPDR